MTEHLHYPFLLLTHVICADGQIHSEEAKALHQLAVQVEINEATQAEMDKILAQDSAHITLEEIAAKIPPEARTESLRQVIAVAYVDGYFDPLEKSLVDQLVQLWAIDQFEITQMLETAQGVLQIDRSQSQTQESGQLSTGAKLLQGAQSLLSQSLVNKLAALAPQKIGQEIERLQREILLSGPEYGQAIEQCTKIAQEDLVYAKGALQNSFESLKTLGSFLHHGIQKIEKKIANQGQHESAREAAQKVSQTRQHLESKLLEDLENVKHTLLAKQRALQYFSIAFMGRTKAGKSTLHSIITNQGWESIGVGKQRTTRYNRIYEWNNIRIIDTPGIGAPGGKTDEEIASSVAAEADLICYVVTNDSIQESEFAFLKSLKEKAKPVIILLNIQLNLRDSRRLERFLSNPDRYFAMEGSNGIQGHLSRIRRYAQQHYSNEHLPIIPVMLLAAQMSKEVDGELSRKLFKASRIQDFLDSLRISIIDDGPIRRSQTLLGSTVGDIYQPRMWIQERDQAYHQFLEQLDVKREGLSSTLRKLQDRQWQTLEQSLNEIFKNLRSKVDRFAEEHWEDSSTQLEAAWRSLLKDIKLFDQIENAVNIAVNQFQQEIQAEIEEIGKELQILNRLQNKSFRFSNQSQGFFDKDFVRNVGIGFGLLGLAALIFPPLGAFAAVFTAIGGVLSFASSFLKSKAEKRSDAVENIKKSLKSQIEEQQKEIVKQSKNNFDQYCKAVIHSVDLYFKELSQGIGSLSEELAKTGQRLDASVNYLNRAYAKRIIDWSTNSYADLTDVLISRTIRKVNRDFGSTIKIFTTTTVDLSRSEAEMSEILQEQVSIISKQS